MRLYQRVDDSHAEGIAAYNLGRAYTEVPSVRDLDQAGHWYQRSIERFGPGSTYRRAQVTGQLGLVAYQRFLDAAEAGEPVEQLDRHLQAAITAYEQALQLLPTEDVRTLAAIHHQLGVI